MKRATNPGGSLAPVIMLAGIGGLAYYGYTQGWFKSLLGTSTTTGTPPITTTPPATTGGTPSTSANFNSLANIYARIGADITAHETAGINAMLSLYQWNFYLGRSWSGVQPDSSAFANVANFDPAVPMSLNAYWSGASIWLAANAGLSGVQSWGV